MMYTELHCHSNFSLLDGAGHPEELVSQAAALGYQSLALTDHDAVYGAMRFVAAAEEYGIQPILGAELTLKSGHHLTLLVEQETGWHNLCYLISRAQALAPKGEAALPREELIGCTNGLIALSGCVQGEVASALLTNRPKQAFDTAAYYKDLFGGDNFFIELQHHYQPHDDLLVSRLVDLARHLHLPFVATNNVHYPTAERKRLQDILVCIRHNTTIENATQRRVNSEYYLKSPDQMDHLFDAYPTAVTATQDIAARCQYRPVYGLQDLPHFETPHGMSSAAYLRRLCLEALAERYPRHERHRPLAQLNHELRTIEAADLANYFLIVWDIVRFARSETIACQGRGSAANSIVAYLLHISPVDPLAHDLVFERFLSSERRVVPDIDIDFDAGRREEVIQYLYQTYGAAHTAMACTIVTFRRRSALRDIGRVLGVRPEIVSAAAREVADTVTQSLSVEERSTIDLMLALADEIAGYPRHLGIHSGGMIITDSPLMGRVPTEPATMADRVVVQWDKDSLETAGLIKIDILGLRMLSAVTEAVAQIEALYQQSIVLEEIPFDDPAVYDMITAADTIGVFQVESRAQAQVLPRLHPTCFADLIVAISLIRPGPIQGNMVHPYLRRRAGDEPVSYLHPHLTEALRETLGVILFQEQILKVARDVAGFTAGQGELLRRALGAKDGHGAIAKLRDEFMNGAAAQGVPADIASQIFQQMAAFGSYSFPKSHAAAFASLVYRSAWLKRNYPACFYTAILNNQPMGFWQPAVLVSEIKRQGIPVHGLDIYRSEAVCKVEFAKTATQQPAIRLGFNYIRGLPQAEIERILAARQQPFTNLNQFHEATQLSAGHLERLILAGAFDSVPQERRHMLWQLNQLRNRTGEFPLEHEEELPVFEPLTVLETMFQERETLHLSTHNHILTFYRDDLQQQGYIHSRDLATAKHGRRIQLAGQLVVHQSPPTAKGFHFLTLEDEYGLVNVIVRPAVYQRDAAVLQFPFLVVSGTIAHQNGTTNVLAVALSSLTL